MEKRFLLRMPQKVFDDAFLYSSARGISLNEYFVRAIKERVERDMGNNRILIDNVPSGEVQDGIIVTNYPWYMDLFHNHKMYFYNPDTKGPKYMKYIFFYETIETGHLDKQNENARHIRYIARAKEIIFDVRPLDFPQIPELMPLTQDPYYWDFIKQNNEPRHVILLGEVHKLKKPLPLKDHRSSRYLVGKTVSLFNLIGAEYIEDLYKKEE